VSTISDEVSLSKKVAASFKQSPKKRLPQHKRVTSVVVKVRNGLPLDHGSGDHELLELVYQELRDIANQAWLRAMGGGLQASDLVNEAWLRILKAKPSEEPWKNRAHFFNTVARTMQQAILDELRRLYADKREGNHRRVSLDLNRLSHPSSIDHVLAVSEALELLESHHSDAAMVVRMRHFLGYSLTQIAVIREAPTQEISKLWMYGRTWIKAYLDPNNDHDPAP
jgi:RNA polymerase sigma factor (TIGR02999 family)